MHKPILACTLVCLNFSVAVPAQAETWYPRPSANSPNQGVAAPLEYCLRTIAITGGVCARHNDQSGDQTHVSQSSRRAEQPRRDRRDRLER